MDKIKIIREALESIEGAWIDAVPLEKINKALQALAELEQQEFEKKLTPDIKELMIEDYVRCMKKAGLQGSGKFLSSYFEQPTVNEDIDQLIHLLDAKLNKFIMLCMTSNRYNSHDLEFILQEFKKSLSQVKPSVWKKYPEHEPKLNSRIIKAYLDEYKGIDPSGLDTPSEWLGREGHIHPERLRCYPDTQLIPFYWCYEADLIKTIKE